LEKGHTLIQKKRANTSKDEEKYTKNVITKNYATEPYIVLTILGRRFKI
jgi:hypothetical protein